MKDIYYSIINVLQCLELGPRGELYKSTGACPTPEENPPRRPDTGGGGTSDDQSSRRRRQEPGGDGVVEGRALDGMNELHRERIVFKGTDHMTPCIVGGSANQPEPQ